MMKTIVAGTLAVSLAGAGLAFAQSSSNTDPDTQSPPRTERSYRPSAEDRAAFTDARIAALKAGLRLNADQEKSWPAVETALRDLAKQRAERQQKFADRMRERREAREAGSDQARPDLYERLRRAADRMTARASSVKQLADAVGPLYASLDDGQKRRLAMLMRMERPQGDFGWRRSRYDGDDGESRRGDDRDGPRWRGHERGQRRWIDQERRGGSRDDDEPGDSGPLRGGDRL